MHLDPFHFGALSVLALFVGTLIHEDVAILSGAYLVAHDTVPLAVVLPTLLLGVVVGDFMIYGLGAFARRTAGGRQWWWLRRRMESVAEGPVAEWLRRNLFVAVASCRVMPLALFPTFGTCGWLGIPFRRFAVPVFVSALLYVPAMFVLFRLCGDGLTRWIDAWGWSLAGALLIAAYIVRRRLTPFATLRGTSSTAPRPALTHPGMPPLRPAHTRLPLSERLNEKLFYVPLVAHWLYLAARYRCLTLPALANPHIEAGGLLGESKFGYFVLAGGAARRWLAPTVRIERPARTDDDALSATEAAMAAAGIAYPAVAKPDIAWRGYGCRLIADRAALADYLGAFPHGKHLLLQEYVAHHGEAGVFYARMPGEARGRIISLTLRYYPFIVGDGRSTLGELVRTDSRLARKARMLLAEHRARVGEVPARGETVRLALVGSNRVGGIYIDARARVSPALADRFEAIASAIPEFHYGRFDVRFADIERFLSGEDFSIIEVNGAGAEAIHVWDPEYRLADAYRDLFWHQSLLFRIGAANRARGFTPMRVRDLVRCQRRQYRLNSAYPPSS